MKEKLGQLQQWGDALHVAVLRPVFPRTQKDARVHTQALDRDSLLIRDGNLHRLDLQLIAMIENARERLQRFQLEVEPLVLLWGFGESALFVNRFALIHPERVKGAAIGAPGGWFMAPSSRHSGKDLRYPIGVSDLPGLVDRSFFRQAFQKEPLFLYLGDRDRTDLLSRSDAYDPQDRDLILSLFGQTPLQRWNETIELYRRADCQCVFQLYEGVDQDYPDWVTEDVMTFLKEQML